MFERLIFTQKGILKNKLDLKSAERKKGELGSDPAERTIITIVDPLNLTQIMLAEGKMNEIQPLVRVYFELLAERKLSAAGKALNDVRQGVHSTQWLGGYVNALEGMLVASESKNDERLFINKIDSGKVVRLGREFFHQSRNELQAGFDRGFFSA